MILLPTAYLPSTHYMARLQQGDCVIDLGEHFIKRSERNRARILAPDGPLDLTAQVCNANRPQQPVRDLRLDYSKRWQHQHWGALVASYKSSPYFDFYADYFAPFYERQFEFLADYNMQLLTTVCELLQLNLPQVSSTYIEARPDDIDLRPKQKKDPVFIAEPYVQVFSDRMPFQPDLSIIDLLCAEGPASVSVLARCRF